MACENWDKCRHWALDDLLNPSPDMREAGRRVLGLPEGNTEAAEAFVAMVLVAKGVPLAQALSDPRRFA